MIALVVVPCVALALYVWLDVYPLLLRLVALRERRLDADLAAEARLLAERERQARTTHATDLPDDIEAMAREWGDEFAAEATRRRAHEIFAMLRDDAPTDDEAWQRVRVALAMEADGRHGEMEVLS